MTDTISSSSPIEVLRPDFPRGHFKAVLFDFDGTLSLIRRNWQAVMIPMMVDVLAETGSGETREQLAVHVEEFVMRLNGKQTIYQMMQLADEVTSRGGTPKAPLEYKHRYHDLLWEQIEHRVAGLKDQSIDPDELTVPGSRRLLEQLRDRGLTLYLASGTDLKYVQDEVRALKLEDFFGPHIYGALDDHQSFSKAMIIERLLKDMGVRGDQLLAFGDGYVEIEETRRNGGVAVGVASEEETRQGVNAWKRDRLIRAGADIIIGDYRRQDELLHLLGL
ncbi:MAG TPA: HAD family hydrolase [Pirellulales bacterium]|jgi:beta-phosphoglucomutase-like phosphatase (HAD superfamily)|nr:HAD family hydrolase [Pirellulales bacterium]